jgi:hypothetical protein
MAKKKESEREEVPVGASDGTEQNEIKTGDANSVFYDKAKGLFKDWPNAKELYFTSDGFAFFESGPAIGQARHLENKDVVKITKELCYQE